MSYYCTLFWNFKLVSKLTPVRGYGNLLSKEKVSFASKENGIA